MSERRSVTRLQLAKLLDDNLPRMAFRQYGEFYNNDPDFDIEAYYDRVASAIFDALPATPTASGAVDAALWTAQVDSLLSWLLDHGLQVQWAPAAHQRIDMLPMSAAIRAESAGTLDVERLAQGIHEYGGVCRTRYGRMMCVASDHRLMADAIAAEYARLAEDAE